MFMYGLSLNRGSIRVRAAEAGHRGGMRNL
jgi:hypothetical protein